MGKLLCAQFGAAILAGLIFMVGLEPRIAGLIAGTAFIAVGIYGVLRSWPERRNRHMSLAVLGMSLIHLLVVALPMMGFRVLNWNEPFSAVAVWGLSGPEFHVIATRLYGVWILLVMLTWWLERQKKEPRGPLPKA